jgi:hypothetical protein
LIFDKRIESVRVEDLIETVIKRMPARRGQFVGRNPEFRSVRPITSPAHRHACSVERRIGRVDPVLRH